MKRPLGFLAVSVSLISVVFLLLVFARQQSLARVEAAKAERIAQQLSEVKAGVDSVGLSYPELLPLLAAEPECVEKLTDITFWCDVDQEHAAHVASLENVEKMYFYCTDPSPVLPHTQGLPIKEITFELVQLSPAEVQSLGQIESLERVAFQGQRISPDYLAILKELPDRIQLDLTESSIESE